MNKTLLQKLREHEGEWAKAFLFLFFVALGMDSLFTAMADPPSTNTPQAVYTTGANTLAGSYTVSGSLIFKSGTTTVMISGSSDGNLYRTTGTNAPVVLASGTSIAFATNAGSAATITGTIPSTQVSGLFSGSWASLLGKPTTFSALGLTNSGTSTTNGTTLTWSAATGSWVLSGSSTLITGTIPYTQVSGLGNAATLNTGTTAGTVAAGDDSRFSGGGGGATWPVNLHNSTSIFGGADNGNYDFFYMDSLGSPVMVDWGGASMIHMGASSPSGGGSITEGISGDISINANGGNVWINAESVVQLQGQSDVTVITENEIQLNAGASVQFYSWQDNAYYSIWQNTDYSIWLVGAPNRDTGFNPNTGDLYLDNIPSSDTGTAGQVYDNGDGILRRSHGP